MAPRSASRTDGPSGRPSGRTPRGGVRHRIGEAAIKHCVVCARPVRVWKGQHAPYLKVSCPECGDYGLTLLGLAKVKNASPEALDRIRSALAEARRGGWRIDVCRDERGALGTRRGRKREWGVGP